MRVLLDTCVLAEIRHPKGNARVKSVVAQFGEESIFLSVLTLAEISKGIALLPTGDKKRDLAEWLRRLDELFSERILPIDNETAQLWGQVTGRAQLQGALSFPDLTDLWRPLPCVTVLLSSPETHAILWPRER